MKNRKIVKRSFLVLLLALGLYGLWYLGTYSMEVAPEIEVNKHLAEKNLLIVTQKSPYKDALTAGIIAGVSKLPVSIKVIDLTTAAAYQVDEHPDACLLMHTWELWRPPGMVRDFRKKLPAEVPLFVISTSGSGEEFLDDGLDGISSASVIADSTRDIRTAVTWVRFTLGFEPDSALTNRE